MIGTTMFHIMWAANTTSKISTPLSNHVSDLFNSASDSANKISALETSLSRLDASFDRIEHWLYAFTAVLVVGLIVEYWDDVREFRHALRERRGGLHRPFNVDSVWHPTKAVIGGVLVVVGVSGELVEEYNAAAVEVRERIASGRVDALLGLEASQARDDAAKANKSTADLTGKFGGLKDLVHTTETNIQNEVTDFQKKARLDEQQASAAIAELNRDKAGLDKAQSDARSALEAAKSDLQQMQSFLAQEAVMRQEFQTLVEPRDIPPKEQTDIVNRLKPFKGRSVVLQIYFSDWEAYRLSLEIGDALRAAGLTVTPRYVFPDTGPNFMLLLGWEVEAPEGQHDLADALYAAIKTRVSLGARTQWFKTAEASSVTLFIGVKPFPLPARIPPPEVSPVSGSAPK